VEFFFGFFNGICEAKKSERSWEGVGWELREFSEKIEKNNFKIVKNREKSGRKSEKVQKIVQTIF
jgi:hypothetical protein